MNAPILTLCSVEAEARPLLDRLNAAHALDLPGLTAWIGRAADRTVWCVQAGMGKVNAAHATTAALRETAFAGIVGFGIAGAYPGSGLAVGDVAVATSDEYGDEGSLTPKGWISCEGIGIPLVERGGKRHFNRFDCNAELVETAAGLESANRSIRTGHFLTLSCCSGTDESAARMEQRFGAICESMEGAAYAHIAALYGVPFLGVRGISNIVENRNPSAWRIPQAAEAAAATVAALVDSWPSQ